MANTSSAKKALRVSARRKKVNSITKDNYRTAKKAVLKAVSYTHLILICCIIFLNQPNINYKDVIMSQNKI